jgi:hypothetical protein
VFATEEYKTYPASNQLNKNNMHLLKALQVNVFELTSTKVLIICSMPKLSTQGGNPYLTTTTSIYFSYLLLRI